MNAIPTVEICHLLPLIRFLQTHGKDHEKYLGEAHIPSKLLEYPHYRISKNQYFAIHNLVVQDNEVSEAFDRIGGFNTYGDLYGIAPSLAQAPSLLCLIRQYADFLIRSADFGVLYLDPEPTNPAEVWIHYQAHEDGLDTKRDAVWRIHLTSLLQIIRLCAGSDWIPSHIALQHNLQKEIYLPSVLRAATVRRIPWGVGICFPTSLLWMRPNPVQTIAPTEVSSKENINLELISARKESFSSSLETLLKSQLIAAEFCPTYEEAAEICNISTRSLNRRLFKEGTNYRELVSLVRFNQARTLLETEPLMKVETIAMLLGYLQLPGFVRAFKSMAGVSPSRYRALYAGSELDFANATSIERFKRPLQLDENKSDSDEMACNGNNSQLLERSFQRR